jgi:hypothetical protein
LCETQAILQGDYLPEQGEEFVLLKSLSKDLKEKILRYVKLKCQEQKKYCAENAKLLPLAEGIYQ